MKPTLETLLKLPNTWQASRGPRLRSSIASGYEALDKALHLGGWPQAATSEILLPTPGIGEMGVLLPALQRLQQQMGWLALINAPWLPFAKGFQQQGIDSRQLLLIKTNNLKELLWAADQCLSSGLCSAVLTWANGHSLQNHNLRRLQQAAASGQCWHILFREQQARQQASPSALRVSIQPTAEGQVQIEVLKQRGGWSGQQLVLKGRCTPSPQPQEQPVHLVDLPQPSKLGHQSPHLGNLNNVALFHARSQQQPPSPIQA